VFFCYPGYNRVSLSLSLPLSLISCSFPHIKTKAPPAYLTDGLYPSEATVLRYPLYVSENVVSKASGSLLDLDRPRRKRHSDIATSARRSLCHHRLSATFAFWHGVVAKINRQLLTRSSHSSVARGPLAVAVQFALAVFVSRKNVLHAMQWRGSSWRENKLRFKVSLLRDGAASSSDYTFCPRVHRTGFRHCLALDSCREKTKWKRMLSFRF
jgi:hypothetical protein